MIVIGAADGDRRRRRQRWRSPRHLIQWLLLLPTLALADWQHAAVMVGESVITGDRSAQQLQGVGFWSHGDQDGWQVRGELLVALLQKPSQESALLLGVGPELMWSSADDRYRWSVGTAVTLVSRHRFQAIDYGGPLQFTSHLGLSRRLGDSTWRLQGRLQHTSNGGIYDPNPGLDTLIIGIGRELTTATR